MQDKSAALPQSPKQLLQGLINIWYVMKCASQNDCVEHAVAIRQMLGIANHKTFQSVI